MLFTYIHLLVYSCPVFSVDSLRHPFGKRVNDVDLYAPDLVVCIPHITFEEDEIAPERHSVHVPGALRLAQSPLGTRVCLDICISGTSFALEDDTRLDESQEELSANFNWADRIIVSVVDVLQLHIGASVVVP